MSKCQRSQTLSKLVILNLGRQRICGQGKRERELDKISDWGKG